jgi:hypothetical protein
VSFTLGRARTAWYARDIHSFGNRCPGVKKSHLAEADGLTFTASLKQNPHNKRDDSSEANPPRDSQDWQPTRLRVELRTKDAGDAIGQSTQDCNDDEADDHCNDVLHTMLAEFMHGPSSLFYPWPVENHCIRSGMAHRS